MFDYQSIIENLRDTDVFNLMEQLGAEPIDKGEFILCRSICHHSAGEEANYKLYYYKNTHLFYCYSSCGPMSIFKLLKEYYAINNIDYDWYTDILQVILNCSIKTTSNPLLYKSIRDEYAQKKNVKNLTTYSNGLIDCFVHYYPIEWLNDSITTEAMDKYNIRFSSVWNKIIIPHYNINNELVGIRGRALNPEEIETVGKYAPIWLNGKCYSHPLSLNLYGLNWNKTNIQKSGICYIFEAEKACLQLEGFSNTINCSVASCGSNINKFQIDILLKYCHPREIVICFDNEEKPGESEYFNKLYNICKKYKNYCGMSFIYDRKKRLPLKASPSDCGEELFRQLLLERIRV